MPQVMDNKTNNRLNTNLNELPEHNSYLHSSLKNELSTGALKSSNIFLKNLENHVHTYE